MMPKSLLRNGWRPWHVWLALAMVALAIFATLDAWKDIHAIAVRDEESSHIFLVPIVFAWLVWVRRARLRQCRPTGRAAGPVIAAAGWLMAAVGYNHAIQSFWHGGSVLIVIGCFVSVAGLEVVKRFLPAFGVLVFLVPVPGMARQVVALPLQTYTAQATVAVFETIGIEVTRSGNVLTVNGADVGIAEACNGMRMVFALALVCYAFTFSIPLRWYVRVIILTACPLAAIICNVIRLVPTVWLYGNAEANTADTFHDLSGWAMIVVAFLLLMGIVSLLRWALVPVTRYTLAYD